MKRKAVIAALILLIAGSATAQSSLLSVTVQYDNGSISVRQVSSYDGYKPVIQQNSGDYSIEIHSADGTMLEERKFEFSRTAYVEDQGEVRMNTTTEELVFENSEEFTRVIVKRNGSKVAEEQLRTVQVERENGSQTSTDTSQQQENESLGEQSGNQEDGSSENTGDNDLPLVPIISVLGLMAAAGGYVVLH